MDGFITTYVWPGAIILAQSLLVLVALLLFIAYILYADRKIWAAVQLRRGPNVVGPWGLFQSFADLLKFVFKEPVIPSGANKAVFLLAPLVAVTLALAAWAVIPFDAGWVIADINVGILFVFAISSLEVYAIIMGGWASNSKYPFLGALRSAAQMVSYEVSIGFVIVAVLLCVGSLNLTDIVMAQADGIGTRMGCRTRCSTGTGSHCSRCSSSSSFRRWQKPTVRPSICRKRNRNWWRASWWSTARRPT
jgi:NADH-quinone oxidoreductase subunit H